MYRNAQSSVCVNVYFMYVEFYLDSFFMEGLMKSLLSKLGKPLSGSKETV